MPGATITEATPVHRILDHIGEPHDPPSIRPADHRTGSTRMSRSSWTKTSIRTATRSTNLQERRFAQPKAAHTGGAQGRAL
jgi:hypothetical protein